ncbi:MAG TPA: hypothetical protein VIK14_17760 [Ignavibacteria bacterium]
MSDEDYYENRLFGMLKCERNCRKDWHEKNKDYFKAYFKAWHEKNKDYSKNYNRWHNINNRCYNTNNNDYKNYGARGIANYWRYDRLGFTEYISKLEHYKKSGYTLDRIDNDGNYEPGNLRWATAREQQQNKRIK